MRRPRTSTLVRWALALALGLFSRAALAEDEDLLLDGEAPAPVSEPAAPPSRASPPRARSTERKTSRSMPRAATERAFHWVVGLGYHSAKEVKFDKATLSLGGTTGNGTAVFNSQPAYELSVGALYSRKHAFGGYGLLTYQTNREVDSVDLVFGSNKLKISYSTGKPAVQAILLEAGAVYRWDRFYLTAGLNHSLPGFADVTDETGTKTTASGALGEQGGFGFYFTRGFHFEIVYKILGVSAKSSGGGFNVDYGTGYATGYAGQLRYAF